MLQLFCSTYIGLCLIHTSGQYIVEHCCDSIDWLTSSLLPCFFFKKRVLTPCCHLQKLPSSKSYPISWIFCVNKYGNFSVGKIQGSIWQMNTWCENIIKSDWMRKNNPKLPKMSNTSQILFSLIVPSACKVCWWSPGPGAKNPSDHYFLPHGRVMGAGRGFAWICWLNQLGRQQGGLSLALGMAGPRGNSTVMYEGPAF